jgi:hypothetical protein
MKALSIRAPWWWWILYGGKDIENRDWPTSYRGPVLIHASKWWQPRAVKEDNWSCQERHVSTPKRPGVGAEPPTHTFGDMMMLGGHIVGIVDLVDCVTESDSHWFEGRYGFVLRHPRPIMPVAIKGRLGLFDVDERMVRNP